MTTSGTESQHQESLIGQYSLTLLAATLSFLSVIIGYLTLIHQPYEPLPVFGHLFALAGRPRQYILDYFLAASKHFDGRPWRNEIPVIGRGWVINNASDLKHVLTSKHACFAKGRFFKDRAKDIFESGILLATGKSWKAQRSAGHIFLTPPSLKHFAEVTLPRNSHVLLDPLYAAAKEGRAVDLQSLSLDFSLAVFGDIAFDTNWQRMSDHFSQPFDDAASTIADRFTLPFHSILEAIFPYGKRLRSNLARVHRFSRQLVREALGELQEEEEGKREKQEGKGLLVRALLEHGFERDDKALANSCLNFLTAGRDTTGQAIAWTVYLLLRNSSYLDQIRAEIDMIPPDLTQNDLAFAVPLLEASISESLRLQPPVPFEILENVSDEPITLPSGVVVVPGEQVLWSAWVMARLPTFWGEDCQIFRPERWFDMPRRPTAYEWPVFHAGSRSCLGQPLARIELTYALVQLIKTFDIEAAWDGGKRVVATGLTAPIQGGLPVRVNPRRNSCI